MPRGETLRPKRTTPRSPPLHTPPQNKGPPHRAPAAAAAQPRHTRARNTPPPHNLHSHTLPVKGTSYFSLSYFNRIFLFVVYNSDIIILFLTPYIPPPLFQAVLVAPRYSRAHHLALIFAAAQVLGEITRSEGSASGPGTHARARTRAPERCRLSALRVSVAALRTDDLVQAEFGYEEGRLFPQPFSTTNTVTTITPPHNHVL